MKDPNQIARQRAFGTPGDRFSTIWKGNADPVPETG
jgi:hypothetical protein